LDPAFKHKLAVQFVNGIFANGHEEILKFWSVSPFQCRTIQKFWPASPFQSRNFDKSRMAAVWLFH